MRKVLVAGTAVAFALAMAPQSFAQDAAAPAVPSLSEQVPMPDTEAYTGFWRITAISVGAVVGVVVVNAITGGMITPMLLAGAPEAMAAMPAAVASAPAAAGAAVVDAAAAAPAAVAAAPAAVAEAAAAAPAAAAAGVDTAAAGGAAVVSAGTAAVDYTMMAYQGVATLVGTIGGGYIGNWIYGE